MEQMFIDQLIQRDRFEKNYQELFKSVNLEQSEDNNDAKDSNIESLKLEIRKKEVQINELYEIINIKNKDFERLNDELISISIENNLFQDKLNKIQIEYDNLLGRWLTKVQKEADAMNESMNK